MKSVIHLETQIVSTFCVVDEDGNVVQRIPALGPNRQPVSISVLSEKAFLEIFNNLIKLRDDIKKNVENSEKNENDEPDTLPIPDFADDE